MLVDKWWPNALGKELGGSGMRELSQWVAQEGLAAVVLVRQGLN